MKFGDIIKSVNKGELKPETLQMLGKRYYEKFDTSFSKLFHSHFNLADELKNVSKTTSIRDCCDKLANIMNKTENTNGWLFEKSLKILNKVLGENFQSHEVSGEIIINIPKDKIINDIKKSIEKNIKEIELKDINTLQNDSQDCNLSNNLGNFEKKVMEKTASGNSNKYNK